MSWLGGWRYFLPAITDLEQTVGQAATEMLMRTGDLRHVVQDPGAHICQMFRWSEIQSLLQRTGGRLVGASASNWASLGDTQVLARLEADPERWERFV